MRDPYDGSGSSVPSVVCKFGIRKIRACAVVVVNPNASPQGALLPSGGSGAHGHHLDCKRRWYEANKRQTAGRGSGVAGV